MVIKFFQPTQSRIKPTEIMDQPSDVDTYILAPNTTTVGLTRTVSGMSHEGVLIEADVVEERPLTIYLNATEILTAMSVGDYPEYLALGFLSNQGMISSADDVQKVDFDSETQTVVVRTLSETVHEAKLKRKIRTSGCALGTVFGELYDRVTELKLPQASVRTSWLYQLSSTINRTPSLYLKAGAIHGTVLCRQKQPLVYMEDVGRHNAVDKIAGWMLSCRERGDDKILYTTGRLTSEMVIKTAMMGIPVLASRSGFTGWGVELAKTVGMTLIGRLRGRRFICLSGQGSIVFDKDATSRTSDHTRRRQKSTHNG